MIKFTVYIYLLMSLSTMLAFFIDKRLAENGARRIPEKWLHTLELLGGWAGALIASELFKHKRQKTKYMYLLYAISLLHILSWIAYVLS